jgi:hypothetical protein
VDVQAPGGPEPNKSFFGIWCKDTIGRINIFDLAGIGPDAIDNIQMWMDVPVPVESTSWGRIKARYVSE